jgi:dTDP-4-dehydrorhamnose 3,5-epimerase
MVAPEEKRKSHGGLMPIEAFKDKATVDSHWEPIAIPLDGVRIVRTRNVTTRNGYTTELFRSDWPETSYDARHVMTNRWDTIITTDWHCHSRQTDHISVVLGRLLIGLYDNRPASPSYEKWMTVRSDWADPQTVVIPPNVFHAFKVLTAPAIMLNPVTEAYRYDDPDHWRLHGEHRKRIPLDLASLE